MKNNWAEVKLSELCEINMVQSPPSSSYNYNKEGLPFYQGVKDFGHKYPIPTVFCNTSQKIAEPQDVLLSVRAPIGTVDESLIHPREVFSSAIRMNASNICIVHNHPGGSGEPSEDEIGVY